MCLNLKPNATLSPPATTDRHDKATVRENVSNNRHGMGILPENVSNRHGKKIYGNIVRKYYRKILATTDRRGMEVLLLLLLIAFI